MTHHNSQVENRNKNWETAWHIAAAHGAVSCLEKLAKFIENVNIQDRQGRSALHHASVRGTPGYILPCSYARWRHCDFNLV